MEKRARKALSEFKEQFEMIVSKQREPNLIMLEKQLKEPWQMSELLSSLCFNSYCNTQRKNDKFRQNIAQRFA